MPDIEISVIDQEIAPDLDTQQEILAELGVGLVTLRACDGKNMMALPVERVGEIAESHRSRNVEPWCLASPVLKMDLKPCVGIGAPFREVNDFMDNVVQAAIARAKAAKVQGIRIFTGYLHPNTPRGYWDDVSLTYFVPAATAINDADLDVYVEDEGNTGLRDAKDCVRYLRKAGIQRGVTVARDLGNEVIIPRSKNEIVAGTAILGDWLGVLHVKDVKPPRGGFHWSKGRVNESAVEGFVLAGQGNGCYPQVIGELVRGNYVPSRTIHPMKLRLDLEPHYTMTKGKDTQYGGTSGPEGVRLAHAALMALLKRVSQ